MKYTKGQSYPIFSPASRVSDVTFVTFFCDKKCDASHLSHFWEECDALAHEFFCGTCDVFCHILPEQQHILALLLQHFLNRQKCDDSDWNMFFSSRLRFVTHLGSMKPEGHLGSDRPKEQNSSNTSKKKFNCCSGCLISIHVAGFWFFLVNYATTQVATQLRRRCIQVMYSNTEDLNRRGASLLTSIPQFPKRWSITSPQFAFPTYSNGAWSPQWTCSQRFDTTTSAWVSHAPGILVCRRTM